MNTLTEKNITATHGYNAWVSGLVNHKGNVYHIEPDLNHPEYDDFKVGKNHFYNLWPITDKTYKDLLELHRRFIGESTTAFSSEEYNKIVSDIINSDRLPVAVVAEFIHEDSSENIKEVLFHGS